jgi:hypothetical protein
LKLEIKDYGGEEVEPSPMQQVDQIIGLAEGFPQAILNSKCWI